MFTEPDTKIYSAAATIAAFEAATGVALERQTLYFTGIFRKIGTINYNGDFYNRLEDNYFQNKSVTLLTPKPMHEMLVDGMTIEFDGFVGHKVDFYGNMKVTVYLTNLRNQKITRLSESEQQELELLRKKSLQGFKNVNSFIRSQLIKKEQVIVKIITGHSNVAETDIKTAMGEIFEQYTIRFKRISLESRTEIIHALKQQDHADIICLARGGGDSIAVFNDIDICKQLMLISVPTASAIGHASDITLFQKLVDAPLATPTSLGHYLKEIYIRTKMELENNASAWSRQLRQIQDLSNRKELLGCQKEIERLNLIQVKKDRLLIAMTVLLIILISVLIWGYYL